MLLDKICLNKDLLYSKLKIKLQFEKFKILKFSFICFK